MSTVKVKLLKVIEGLELQFDDATYFLNKQTGEVVFVSNEEFRAAEEEPLERFPEWQRQNIGIAGEILSSDNYINQLSAALLNHFLSGHSIVAKG